MLSPGEWHKQVPKGRDANLRFRLNLLRLAKSDRRAQKALVEACRQDILFYINAFVWQYNPRKKPPEPKVAPFITWDFQDDALLSRDPSKPGLLWCVENDEDAVIEKSREMGASWLCLLVIEWLWHFHPWNKFLAISRNAEAVEDDDPDSLFWKLDFVHTYLPGWLMPPGYEAKTHRRKMYFGNPNGSTITGQASTGKAGVGGRATAMFIDEFSQIKEDYEVLHRTSDTTGCRIFNGTHCGVGTAFHELTQRVDIKKIVMHWTQHPEKNKGLYRYNPAGNVVDVLDPTYPYPENFEFVMAEAPAGGPHPGVRSPWYDRECLRKGSPRAVAMDLDIDAGGSVAQFFNPLTIRVLQATYCCPPYWEGDLVYDRASGRPQGLVKLAGGPLKLWCVPTSDNALPPAPYGAGADISAGLGATNSCFSAGSARTGEKVLEYASPHILPENFAPICVALCWLLKDERGDGARFAWEHAGPGQTFGKRVMELGYRNIYYREANQTLAGGKVSEIPGWFPSNTNKRLLLDEYRAALDSRSCINRSEPALQECLPYRYNPSGDVEHPSESGGDDPTGARINHGDRVMADALMWKMIDSMGLSRRSRAGEDEQAPVGSLAWRRQLHDNRLRQEQWV